MHIPLLPNLSGSGDCPVIAVAVSGGADSLYSLIRLREQSVRVLALHGIFLAPTNEDEAEAAGAMRQRLAETCSELDVPLHVADLTDIFLRQVIEPFVRSYAAGQTPNPCALCNARIKFGLLLRKAESLGAAYLATGHYARLVHSPSGGPESFGWPPVWPALLQGSDPDKDQSYFLSLVPLEALASALFPLGETTKKEVLGELARRGMSPPAPGESQEVCFVPNDAYRVFLPSMAARLGMSLPGPGPMLLTDGSRVGTHKGLWQYTEGQRRGLGIAWREPLHVLAKEMEANVLRLGARQEMRVAGCECVEANILLPPACWPEIVWVKTRYRERPKAAEVSLREDGAGERRLRIRFLEPESAVAPGQVAAVYVPAPGAEPSLRLVAGALIAETF